MDNSPGEEVSAGQSKADTTEVGQNYICGLPKEKRGIWAAKQRLSLFRTNGTAYYGDKYYER